MYCLQCGAGKKLTAAQKAAEAKRLAEEEEARRAAHWRSKVLRAKRKLYLLLLGYMKWMTVLKKRRRGCVRKGGKGGCLQGRRE
jgi:hypothetical protein